MLLGIKGVVVAVDPSNIVTIIYRDGGGTQTNTYAPREKRFDTELPRMITHCLLNPSVSQRVVLRFDPGGFWAWEEDNPTQDEIRAIRNQLNYLATRLEEMTLEEMTEAG